MRSPARFVRRIDAFQQRNRALAFPVAVVKKCADDNAGMLSALIAYYGFLAVFPLMLLLVTGLGFALHGNPALQQRVLQSALRDVPVLGDQIRENIHALRASPVAIGVGVVVLVWGSLGVTRASQYAMAQIWSIAPGDRPGLVARTRRGLGFIGTLGAGIALTTLLTQIGAFGGSFGSGLRALSLAAGVGLSVTIYVVAFRLLTPPSIRLRDLIPGAILGGIGWSVLQLAGTYLVEHQLRHTSQVYGVFAVVLGLLWWLFLIAQLTLYAAEVNVVHARGLWPRPLVSPPASQRAAIAYT